MPSFYEFFAGGGMARAGLGAHWQCEFANDFDEMKTRTYAINWGSNRLHLRDINSVTSTLLPGRADLAWASFPCQDLSLAGNTAGIGQRKDAIQSRSGTFWAFARIMRGLSLQKRAPTIIVLENVRGLLTVNHGRDFASVAATLQDLGYRVGATIIDARHFVPQSRPRVFFIAIRKNATLPADSCLPYPSKPWHPEAMQAAVERLPPSSKKTWTWWNLGQPPSRTVRFIDLIEDDPTGVHWSDETETRRIIDMMSEVNLKKLEDAIASQTPSVGGVYFRTRLTGGVKIQRAEVRFDDIAGCLRTPGGGSSRQRILVVQGRSVRSRLLSTREAARLMGLPDSYKLPDSYNDAYHVAGDGVVVPAVAFLRERLLDPIISANQAAVLHAAE